MRTRILLMGLLLAAVANAQTIYHDASAFPLLGKATESTLTRYERLPDSLQNKASTSTACKTVSGYLPVADVRRAKSIRRLS